MSQAGSIHARHDTNFALEAQDVVPDSNADTPDANAARGVVSRAMLRLGRLS